MDCNVASERASVFLRPTSSDDRELCVKLGDGRLFIYTIGFSQIAYLGEMCNRLVYAKLAGFASQIAGKELTP